MAERLWNILGEFECVPRLDFTITENASADDSIVDHLSVKMKEIKILCNKDFQRLRCIGNIGNPSLLVETLLI